MLRQLSLHPWIIAAACGAIFITSLLPLAHRALYIDSWQGVPQVYQDEINYLSQIDEVVRGHLFFGNPYFYEHRDDATPAFFITNWLAAIPQFLGIPVGAAVLINFSFWSIVFALLLYALLRRIGVSEIFAAAGIFFIFIQNYAQIERASIRQIVFPFLFLFYFALLRWLKEPQDRYAVIFLALAGGATFYVYGFLWQIAVVALGLAGLYALLRRSKAAFVSVSVATIGAFVLALPFIIGTYRSMQLPHYWESMARFGLAHTHLPSAELVYSGSWVLVALFALFLVWHRGLIETRLFAFFVITGLAMPIVQASNVITGKELETGNHVARFIYPWLGLATTALFYFVWQNRHAVLPAATKWGLRAIVVALLGANIYFIQPFAWVPSPEMQKLWPSQQEYAAPLAWLDAQSPEPQVIWADPHDDFFLYVPVLTKHYLLYAEPGTLEFETDAEVYERYLSSSHFEDITADYLKQDIRMFAGRTRTFHTPQVLAREVKLCRIIKIFGDRSQCGEIHTPQELAGDEYFETLAAQFKDEIRPNIDTYLKKYKVAYIVKDLTLDANYHPEQIPGTELAYKDERFQIYKLTY